MECNKDEAMRAKSISEAKFEQKDYFGSKKLAVKAQTLYPGLDGISQMLTTLEIYCSAERKIRGLVDWYGVLGVDPTADDETIKKKYRKLALVLHPDKNPSSGADGAFKLISEAWSLLSDKTKRSAYNQITGFNGSHVKPLAQASGSMSTQDAGGPVRSTHMGPPARSSIPQSQNGGAPAPPTENPPSKLLKRKQPDAKEPKKRAKTKAVAAKQTHAPSPKPKVSSFWTICHECNVKFEYNVMYRDRILLCMECKKTFMAREIPRPVKLSRSHKQSHWSATPQSNSSSNSKDIRNLQSPSVIC